MLRGRFQRRTKCRSDRRPGRRVAVPGSDTRAATRRTVSTVRSAERVDAERSVVAELEAWLVRAVPDRSASFDADALAQLVRSCLSALGVDGAVGEGFSVNTVHYYRRKDILDEPAGRTSAARYDVRHLWQAVGARLAGHLGLVTLAEARAAMRDRDEETLLAFLAARVVDARGRQRLRDAAVAADAAPRVRVAERGSPLRARPLPGVLTAAARAAGAEPAPAVVIPLPGEAWCIVPASHAAHRSPAAARALVTALAEALRVSTR